MFSVFSCYSMFPIIGFNELRDFIILDANKDSFFKWLQSVEDPELAFPIVSVFSMNVDYSIDLPDDVIEALKINNEANLEKNKNKWERSYSSSNRYN